MPKGICGCTAGTGKLPSRCNHGAEMRAITQHRVALLILGLAGGSTVHAGDNSTLLGAGAYVMPVYPGSGADEVRPVPLVEITVWNRLFIRSSDGAGVYLWHTPSSDAGVSIDADSVHRYESDDTRLIGLGDVRKTARANVFITGRCARLDATVKFSTDIGGEGHGSVIDIEMAKFHSITPALGIRAGIGTTWTNQHYMRTFFGVDAQQSERSGLPTFSPGSGFSTARLFVSARYELRPHWQVSAQTYIGRLLGDAADSPITQKRNSVGGGIFLAYVVR
jgi:outer membrane protein